MTDRGERTKCQFKRIEGYLIIDSQYVMWTPAT